VLTTIAAIAGLVFGFTGFVLGILNYRRDRPKLIVRLSWTTSILVDHARRQVQLGRIYITNAGRRPVYITAAGVEEYYSTYTMIRRRNLKKTSGRRLAEGDPPIILVVPNSPEMADSFIERAAVWREIRAFVEDSTGRRYRSSKVWLWDKPRWSVGDGKATDYERDVSVFYECVLEEQEAQAKLLSGDFDVYDLWSGVLPSPPRKQEANDNPKHPGYVYPTLSCGV
jgi:hypothetical protein